MNFVHKFTICIASIRLSVIHFSSNIWLLFRLIALDISWSNPKLFYHGFCPFNGNIHESNWVAIAITILSSSSSMACICSDMFAAFTYSGNLHRNGIVESQIFQLFHKSSVRLRMVSVCFGVCCNINSSSSRSTTGPLTINVNSKRHSGGGSVAAPTRWILFTYYLHVACVCSQRTVRFCRSARVTLVQLPTLAKAKRIIIRQKDLHKMFITNTELCLCLCMYEHNRNARTNWICCGETDGGGDDF